MAGTSPVNTTPPKPPYREPREPPPDPPVAPPVTPPTTPTIPPALQIKPEPAPTALDYYGHATRPAVVSPTAGPTAPRAPVVSTPTADPKPPQYTNYGHPTTAAQTYGPAAPLLSPDALLRQAKPAPSVIDSLGRITPPTGPSAPPTVDPKPPVYADSGRPTVPAELTTPHLRTVSEERVAILGSRMEHGRKVIGEAIVGSPMWRQGVEEYEGSKSALHLERTTLDQGLTDITTLQASADARGNHVLGGATAWGQAQVGKIDTVLAVDAKTVEGMGVRDPDLIVQGEQVVTKLAVPPLRVVTDAEVQWTLRTKADDNNGGGGEAARVATDPAFVNSPLRDLAKNDPIGYAKARLLADHAGDAGYDAEYKQVVERVLPGVRGDYTQDHVTQTLAQGDWGGAITVVKTNLDGSGNSAERSDIWKRIEHRFTAQEFAARFDKIPEGPQLSDLSPNLRGETVGQWINSVSPKGLPPEIATPLASAVQTSVLDRWDDSGAVGPQLYAGLSAISQGADVPFNGAPKVTPAITHWLVQRIDAPQLVAKTAPETFDIPAAVAAGNARLSISLAGALRDPDHADVRTLVIEDITAGVNQLRKDTAAAFDALSEERAPIDFILRNFSDPGTDPASIAASLAQIEKYRARNPGQADSIDERALALGEKGRQAAQVVQDAAAGNLFGVNDEPQGAEKDLQAALFFGRGDRGPIQFEYQNGEQQKMVFAIDTSVQLQQAINNDYRFSPTGVSLQTALGWATVAHQFIGSMTESIDRQTGAPLLTPDQGRALDQNVTTWHAAIRAELDNAKNAGRTPNEGALAKINADFDAAVRGVVGTDWIGEQLRADLPIKTHGVEDLHLTASQLRMDKNAVDLFNKVFLKAGVNGTIREFQAGRLMTGPGLGDPAKQLAFNHYAGNKGWMPFLGVDRVAAKVASEAAVAEATRVQAEIDKLPDGPDKAVRANAIIQRELAPTKQAIEDAIKKHDIENPFEDSARRTFTTTTRSIGAVTNGINAWTQLIVRPGEDRTSPAMAAAGAIATLTAVRDSAALYGIARGRNYAADSDLFSRYNKLVSIGSSVSTAWNLGTDVASRGDAAETWLQTAATAGQVAETLGVLGIEADVAAGFTTGGVGTAVMVAAQVALIGYYELQSIREANRFEVGRAPFPMNAIGQGYSPQEMQDKAAVQSSLTDLGFTPDQTRELLDQTGKGVSPMLAVNQWADSKGLSFEQRMDYLRRLSPDEIRTILVHHTHYLIDRHMDNETLKLPASGGPDAPVLRGKAGPDLHASRVASLAGLDDALNDDGIGYNTVIGRAWTSPLPPEPAVPPANPSGPPQPVIELQTVERGDTLWDLYGGRQGLTYSAYPNMPSFDPAKENGDPYSG
jgi:hypothetical protein